MQPITIRFGHLTNHRAEPRRLALGGQAGALSLLPVAVPTYQALFEVVDQGACDVAWAPPLVALDLLRCGAARPLVSPSRRQGSAYYSALLVRSAAGSPRLGELAGKRIGWVARESAAGFVVPRLYLRSLGIDADAFFGAESFHHTHAQAQAALAAGAVDVIATYTSYDEQQRRFVTPPGPFTLVAASGPIPGDVVVAASALPAVVRQALARALLGLPPAQARALDPVVEATGFVPVSPSHLDGLHRLWRRAESTALRAASALC